MRKKKVLKLIRKSNNLVEAKYKFDIWETRIFTKMLSMIKKDDIDFKDYRIYMKDIIDEYDLSKQLSAYERIRDGAMSLMHKTVRILRETEEGDKVFYTNIIAGFEHMENDSVYIDISFHPKMKPFLLQLKSQFTTYDIRNILKLPSSYSIRIYELLKQYELIGQRKLNLEELKEIVGAIEDVSEGKKTTKIDRYPLYGNFRQKVLLKAQRDLISHTDISFTFEPIKKGRKVAEIIFYISKNKPRRKDQQRTTKKAPKTTHIFDEIEPIIKTWKERPNRELIAKLLNQGKTDDHIRKAVQYTQKKIESNQKVANPTGYFVTMVSEVSKQGDLFDTDQLRAKEKQEKEDKKKQGKALIAELEKEKTKLGKEADKIRDKVRKKILSDDPELLDKVIEELKKKYLTWWDRDKSKEQNLARPGAKGMISGALAKRFPDRFEELTPIKEKIEQIENEIRKLT